MTRLKCVCQEMCGRQRLVNQFAELYRRQGAGSAPACTAECTVKRLRYAETSVFRQIAETTLSAYSTNGTSLAPLTSGFNRLVSRNVSPHSLFHCRRRGFCGINSEEFTRSSCLRFQQKCSAIQIDSLRATWSGTACRRRDRFRRDSPFRAELFANGDTMGLLTESVTLSADCPARGRSYV